MDYTGFGGFEVHIFKQNLITATWSCQLVSYFYCLLKPLQAPYRPIIVHSVQQIYNFGFRKKF